MASRKRAASGPKNRSRPMCEMSNSADRGAGGLVLGGDRRVLDRHLPAGEVDHPPAVCDVPIEERGPGELGSHGHRRSIAGRISKKQRSADSTRATVF